VFEVIAWATDGSEAADSALPIVTELAKTVGAKVVVIHAEEFAVGRAAGYPVHVDEDELQSKIRGQIDKLKGEGLDVTLTGASAAVGNAAHAIARVAEDEGAKLIAVGTRGHSPVAGLLLGSVTQRLLHIAPCPVLVVRPD